MTALYLNKNIKTGREKILVESMPNNTQLRYNFC